MCKLLHTQQSLIYKYTQSLQDPKHAVAVTVIMSHGVVLAVVVPRGVVVTVAVVVVSEALSSHCMASWSRSLHCVLSWSQHRATCGVAVTVVAPCDVAVVVAVIKPRGATATVIVLTSSWPRRRHMSLLSYHCRGQWLGHGRPWRGRMAARPSARRVVRAR